MKYTPGPWEIASTEGGWTNVRPANHPNLPICNLVENNEANALLIAAAPDLLGMLKLAVQYLEHPDVMVMQFALPSVAVARRCHEAIEKAENGR